MNRYEKTLQSTLSFLKSFSKMDYRTQVIHKCNTWTLGKTGTVTMYLSVDTIQVVFFPATVESWQNDPA